MLSVDGGVIVDATPIANTLGSAQYCCAREFVSVLDDVKKFLVEFNVSHADFWFWFLLLVVLIEVIP